MLIRMNFSESKFDPNAWLLERKAVMKEWRRQSSSYKTLIDKLLIIGGDFVHIEKRGEPAVELLASKGKLFRTKPQFISSRRNPGTKTFIVKYAQRDPDRYRICLGYAMVKEHAVEFWSKHYWLVDTKEKVILECTPSLRHKYFGITLSKDGSLKMATTTKTK